MSKAKTQVDGCDVEKFVHKNFSDKANSFKVIAEGESSQAFFFSSEASDYVIRVNKKIEGFEKDKWAYENFSSKDIPIPETLCLGKFSDSLFFSITKRSKGTLLSDCTKEEVGQAMPSIVKTLDAIHATDISGTKGFGAFDITGEAKANRYRDVLLRVIEKTTENFDKGLDSSFIEQNVVENFLQVYATFINFCPEVRYLVHKDFGHNNATVEGGEITGVFDWEHASYGDFLCDVAWLDFWAEDVGFKDVFLEHYKEKKINISNFEERIMCHKLNFGISSMMFFAKSNQEKKYLSTKAKITVLIENV